MERFHVLQSQKHWLGLSTVIISNLTKLKVVSKNILLYFEILSVYEKKYVIIFGLWSQIFDVFKLKMLEHHVHGKHLKMS